MFFLFLSCLAVPLSSTGKSVAIGLALFAILSSTECRSAIYIYLHKPWCICTVGLLLIALIACFWGIHRWPEQVFFMKKYSKLLYLPVLAAGFRDPRARKLGISAILISMLLIAFISCIKYIQPDKLTYWFHETDPSAVFRNHIMTSYMIAFATYLSAVRSINTKSLFIRLLYALLCMFFTFQIMVINTSVTGYVIYFILMFLWLVQHTSRFNLLVGSILAAMIISVSIVYSPILRFKLSTTITDLQNHQNPHSLETSVGYRLQFHRYAEELYLRHPWIGNGTGSFPVLYSIDKPVSSWGWRLTEPHGQYWLIASEWGTLGLIGLFSFFFSLLAAALKLKSMRHTAVALICGFMVCNLTDSFLLYSGTGYFFILMMALCLGES